ncbi:MAG TPA: nucleotidyltransferase domain-containing protein [Syntrophales bacterium]|nr:nucleotidyltransferase domain-containing protein [Syntrophales bacterium]
MICHKEKISEMAEKYCLQMVYAFGSRGKEILDLVEERIDQLSATPSDLDIGVKSGKYLSVEEKVEIAIFFEDLFSLPRVDVVVLDEAPVFLALEIVTGELLYCRDEVFEAKYQLYILAQAGDLHYYQKEKTRMVLGE